MCVLLTLAAPVLCAQQQGDSGTSQGTGQSMDGRSMRGGPPSPAQELERLSQALTLTEQQKAAILPILEKRHTAMQQLMASSSDRSANREQMHTILETTDAEIKAQLTEAQGQIFANMRPGRNGGGPPDSGNSQNGPSGNGGPPQ